MGQYKFIFVFLCLLSYCSCEISYEKKNKLMNGFIDFYNSLPNQIYISDEGYLRNAQQSTEQNSYEVEAILKVSDRHNLDSTKYLRCTGKLVDLAEVGISILNHHCEETTSDEKDKEIEESAVTEISSDATETEFVRKPVQLDNEVQTNIAITSGEQFIAIPREEQKVHCIGCASRVNPQAPGVSELAAIGVRQLNSLEPNTRHTLNSVVDVERQVQVVNGIRYILTLIVDYNNCVTPETETCLDSKTCKITVLEKPWMQLPDGSKYRAILSNNCTEEWRFGDDGVIVPQTPTDDRETNNINTPQTDGLDIIKPVNNVEVQALPHTEKTLTDDDIKVIQQQIIPYKFDEHVNEPTLTATSESTKTSEQTESKEHAIKVESTNQFSPNAIPVVNPVKTESLSEDKKKAIDDMLFFFDFDVSPLEDKTRQRRDTLVGGPLNKDVTSPEIRELAKEALRQYLQSSVYNRHFDIIEILEASIQVVAGSLTRIKFKISPTNCLIDKEGNPSSSDCKVFDYNDVTICTSRIWEKPWLDFKEINTTCEIDNGKIRSKRGLGGPVEKDPNKPEFRKLAQESMQEYLKNNGITNIHTLMTIDRVTAQVVSGTKTNIYFTISPVDQTKGDVISCHSEIWEQPWLKVKEITVNCGIDNNSRAKREILHLQQSSNLMGGQQQQDPTKVEYKELAQVSLNKYLKLQKNSNLHNVVEVKKVTTKVVSGLIYNIEYIAAPKRCADDISTCVDTVLHCAAEIWEQPWLGKKDIKVSCRPKNKKKKPRILKLKNIDETPNEHRSKKQTGTEHNDHDNIASRDKRSVSLNPLNSTTDALIIQNLVQESLNKLEMSSTNRYKQRVLRINSYSTKITSGKVTTIDFDVAHTSCLKYELVDDVKTCEFQEHLPRRHCVSQVWERLWIVNGRNIEVTCEDETPLGAHAEIESSETAMQLANEALKHIEAKYPHPLKQKIVRIFSLDKQVVAGIHYRMKVEVGSTQCPALSADTDCKLDKDLGNNKFCRVNIWLQPWTDHAPNFRVSCDYHENATSELYHHLQAQQLFHNFLTTYKPEYINNTNELKRKFEIFKANIRKINELNIHEKGTATYGVTRFADLSYDEFTQRFLGLKPSLRGTNHVPMRQAEIPRLSIPNKFDWRDHGAVTEVKNQGSCGSCWAFSVTGNIEGQWKMKSGQLVSLSEQELVDCDKLDQGCNGGLPDNAYRAIEQLGGLELETDYPYDGEDDKCSFNKAMSRVQISSAVNITSNETDMAKWLVKNGPISIGINANAMQFYMGGVSHPWKMLCNPTNLDHGVLIVGYGIKDYPLFHKRLPFWTIKNSWGPEWGEQGYYRIFRGDGTCGVNQMASSAVI